MDAFRLFDDAEFFLFGHLARSFHTIVEDLFPLKKHIGGFSELAPQRFIVLFACETCGFPRGLQLHDLFRCGLPAFVVVNVFGQQGLQGGNQSLLFALVHFELRTDAVVIGLDRVKRLSGQPKERVCQLLEGLPR